MATDNQTVPSGDAAVVDVKFRSNSDVTAAWVNGKLLFTFRNGTIRSFNPALVATANRARAELHGWEQRLRDSMALEKDKFPGGKIPASARLEALDRLLDHYKSGSADWSPAASSRSSAPTEEMVLEALRRVYPGKDAKALVEAMAAKRDIGFDEALQVWAASDKIAKEIVVIRSEKKAEGAASADDMLAELGVEGGE